MTKLALLVTVLAICSFCVARPARQLLPHRPGYIPVYIRNGDTPLEEINLDLAEAFHAIPSGRSAGRKQQRSNDDINEVLEPVLDSEPSNQAKDNLEEEIVQPKSAEGVQSGNDDYKYPFEQTAQTIPRVEEPSTYVRELVNPEVRGYDARNVDEPDYPLVETSEKV